MTDKPETPLDMVPDNGMEFCRAVFAWLGFPTTSTKNTVAQYRAIPNAA